MSAVLNMIISRCQYRVIAKVWSQKTNSNTGWKRLDGNCQANIILSFSQIKMKTKLFGMSENGNRIPRFQRLFARSATAFGRRSNRVPARSLFSGQRSPMKVSGGFASKLRLRVASLTQVWTSRFDVDAKTEMQSTKAGTDKGHGRQAAAGTDSASGCPYGARDCPLSRYTLSAHQRGNPGGLPPLKGSTKGTPIILTLDKQSVQWPGACPEILGPVGDSALNLTHLPSTHSNLSNLPPPRPTTP
ncbi:uncharacterized protein CLUP02_14691 [Colletotrichum lupini]|uniref:Uncharacterized protein n=1 Tax=Colletotrichum lupini TaxID=145971 RepID=A0A9Q8T597_9PEZI|nr:uncharacterized protein CLUP02_14691 [Colletotrichum lupini]UQC89163.1 hypothetical protein CLUP02_14691 [Colletotrichum lupini]